MSFVEKINAFIGADKPKLADFYACFDQLYMLLKSGSTLQQAIAYLIRFSGFLN